MQETIKKPYPKEVSPPAIRKIGVIGARTLPPEYREKVGDVVEDLIARGYGIASGGAIGTDQYCLERILSSANAHKFCLFSAWNSYKGFPLAVRPAIREIQKEGSKIVWGISSGTEYHSIIRLSLLRRNEKLVSACYGLVAFLMPGSRGSLFTISKAVQARMPIVVFPINCDPPHFSHVKWVALRCGGYWENGLKAVYLK